jgi:hypothetical protein
MASYSVTFANVTATTGGTMSMTFINPAASPSASLKMIRCWMGQSGTATSAQLNVRLVSKITAFPTLTSTTPESLHRTGRASVITGGTAGAAGTSGTNASVAGAGTETNIVGDVFNNLNGYLWVPQINDPILFDAGSTSGFGMILATTPSVLTGWSGGTNFDEV